MKTTRKVKWGREWGELWGFSVIAAKPAYSANINAISPKGLSDATYRGLKFPPFGKLGK